MISKLHPTSKASFSRWKDVIIPGHIDEWRVEELRMSNRPLQRRDVLVSFHGRYAGNTEALAVSSLFVHCLDCRVFTSISHVLAET